MHFFPMSGLLLSSFLLFVGQSTADKVPTFGSLADGVGQVAGPLGDVLGVVDFVLSKIPDASDVGGTVVTIGTSGEQHKGEDFRGKVKVVWTFDSINHVLGSSDVDAGGMIEKADYAAITVHQHMGESAQGQYVDIVASNDEICISYVLASYPSGPSGPRVWLGDVGAMCGQAWEHSTVTYSAPANETHFSKCVWMDTDHGEDIDYQPQPITNRQMKINMNAYGGDALKEENRNLDYICGATIFTWDIADPIEVPTPKGPVPKSSLDSRDVPEDSNMQKRYDYRQPGKPRQRSQQSAERLVVNSRPQQSAVILCNSPTSRGSDFVSTDEQLFCDMDTKTLYPLCSDEVKTGCFDIDTEALSLRKRGESGRFARSLTKRYKKVVIVD